MSVEFTARRLTIDEKVKDVVEKRLAKLAKVLPRGAQCKVLVRAEKRGVTVEITVTARQRTWAADATEADQLTAAHGALEKVAAQAKKTKAKVKEVKKHTSKTVRAATWTEEAPEAVEKEAPRVRAPRVENVQARQLFDEDAIHAFSHSKKDVLPYRDAADETLKVLYRKKDGSIAILVPG